MVRDSVTNVKGSCGRDDAYEAPDRKRRGTFGVNCLPCARGKGTYLVGSAQERAMCLRRLQEGDVPAP